jgi:hypothetical protein
MASEITHRVPTRIPTPRSTPHDEVPTAPIRILIPRSTPHDEAPTAPIRILIPRSAPHDEAPTAPIRILIPRSAPHDEAPTAPIRIPTPRSTPHDEAPTAPIRIPRAARAPHRLPEKPAMRRAAAVRASTCLRLLVVPLAIGAVQAPWWSELLVQRPQPGALGALLVVPLLAGLVGWRSLRATPLGPQIHDRQLDMILCLCLTALAVELLRLTDEHGPASVYGAGFLVIATSALVSAGWGTRALSQLRGSLAVLLLAWQWPWETLIGAVSGHAAQIAKVLATGTLDPLAGGGVLLPVCVGLLCGIAWATRRTGVVKRVSAVIVGLAGGVLVSAAQWVITGWAATRGATVVEAWTSGAVHLWTLLAMFTLGLGIAAARGLAGRTKAARIPTAPGGTLQAVGRLTAAVPRARFATSVVVTVAVGLSFLAAHALPSHVLGVLS